MNSSPERIDQLAKASKMRLAVIIVHTWAPRANAIDWRAACSAALGPSVEVREVRVAGFFAVCQAAEEAARAGAWLVISVGGDGTACSVINGVRNSETRVAVLPGGTLCELVYSLGQSNDPATSAASLAMAEPIEIDAMRVNGHRFALLAMMGVYAEAATVANRLRGHSQIAKSILTAIGPVFYFLILVGMATRYAQIGGRINMKYRDLTDGSMKSRDLDIVNFTVYGPPTTFYGKYKHCPSSDMADGKIEVTTWERTTATNLFATIASLSKGTMLKMPGVSCIQTDYCEVQCRSPCHASRTQIPFLPTRAMSST